MLLARISLVGLLLCGMPVLAQTPAAPDQHVQVGRLPCTGALTRTHGIRQLAWETMNRTSIVAEMESVAVDPQDSSLFRTPLLLWSCEGPIGALSDQALANLRRFLVLGGFLLVDDPLATPGGEFDRSVRAVLKKIFPDKQLTEVPSNHVVFKTFFLIDRPVGRILSGSLQAIDIGGRLAVVYSPNDLLGAVSKDFFGSWEFHCQPGGDRQREMSFRQGINLIFYALCQDYKDDRVHLPFILRRRKL